MLAMNFAAVTAEAQLADHLACSKVKDPAPRAVYTASITPSGPDVPAAAGCLVKVPAKQLCVDVQTSDVSPSPPGAPPGGPAQRYLCYKTKCPRRPLLTVPATDQFGSRAVLVKSATHLCAPLATTTTTTSTTTTSTEPLRCCSILHGCFDAPESFTTTVCEGVTGTIAAPGKSCDGTTGTCATTGQEGPFCCSCATAGLCFEGPLMDFGDICVALGCTPLVGHTCNPLTHACDP